MSKSKKAQSDKCINVILGNSATSKSTEWFTDNMDNVIYCTQQIMNQRLIYTEQLNEALSIIQRQCTHCSKGEKIRIGSQRLMTLNRNKRYQHLTQMATMTLNGKTLTLFSCVISNKQDDDDDDDNDHYEQVLSRSQTQFSCCPRRY